MKADTLNACNKTNYLPTDTKLKDDDQVMGIEEMKEWIGSVDNMVKLFSHGSTCWSVLHQGEDPDAKYRVYSSFMPECEYFSVAYVDTTEVGEDGESKKHRGATIHDKIQCFDAQSLVYDLLLGDGLDDQNLIDTLAAEDGVTIPKVVLTGLCILLNEEGLAHLSLLPGGGKVVSLAQQLRNF